MHEFNAYSLTCFFQTTLLNVLAGRTDTGVITGDRFVNGQGLPHDFQAQTYVHITLKSVLVLTWGS